jgi:hypothetical protein
VVWFSVAAAVAILTAAAGLEERELRRRFGAAHAAYVAATPDLFCLLPLFLFPTSLYSNHGVDADTDADADVDADATRMKAAEARQQQSQPFAVETAFANNDTKDAVPPMVHLRDTHVPGTQVGSPPPLTPKKVEAQLQQRQQRSQQPKEQQWMEELEEDAAEEDAAAMFPDADELFKAMSTFAGDPSTSSSSTAVEAKFRKTE